jgi:hypothetical protein
MYYKITIAIALFVLTINQSVAQSDPNKTLQQQKMMKYKKMKNAGVILIVVGGILAVTGGIVEASQIDESSTSVIWSSAPAPEHNNTGTVLFCSGLVVAGVGIPLTIAGNRKYKYYKQNPDVISLGVKAQPHATGLSLTFRF